MFRRNLVFFVILGLALSLWTTPAAARTETTHFSFKGLTAAASFSNVDETGCIVTDVFVFATEGRVKAEGNPETTSEASIHIFQFNTCTGEQVLAASGSTTLEPEEFFIEKELDQATLNTTIVVENFLSGATFPVEVNITWTGEGEAMTEKSHFIFKAPGALINLRIMSTFREAQASGTVAGLGINFTPEPAVFADLADVKSGEVNIEQTF